MGFLEAYKSFWKNYVNFSGRAPGSAYWYVFVWNLMIIVPLHVMEAVFSASEMIGGVGGGVALFFVGLRWLYWLATIVPLTSLIVRRLHDTGKSGFLAFLSLIPYVGTIIILIFMSFESDGPNRYGDVYKKSDI
ncbi:DUF805 domain-containing protein [Listeria swaminathanii]|uniref:DUF805 domain-containing protein n=1 Tax=Listeria swaminathanii TaxID=2713501 RepID=A0ABU2IDG2_9LIST|nr:DUF805 domain-containing protein [Listeria swaminathanii]MDT0015983.1 DUF805 domain-containing protein [Listeria swaminathanii]MDT0021419.1 DUF805 domain-containing protein [Listeria swaminathanii]MDT0032383.1 DUF805 domain-containing protein [Listeria swaminathanii]MDT0051767.1 DUF805 domain-containing protein [Listeria swaminathanii]MDT0054532.1 DUF805 domain-containing protein [Listeria swaminathanii]